MTPPSEPEALWGGCTLPHATLGVAALMFASVLACVGGCRHEPPQNEARTGPVRAPGAGAKTPVKIGNDDPSGTQNQPNWDQMAADLKVRVGPRLPTPAPNDPKLACEKMLDAAKSFYTNTEPAPGRRQTRLDELAATRASDLESCVASTSPLAAACVTVLLSDRDSEFPWLLDQCMRAYPRGA